VLAVLAARGVTAFLFGVGAADPATFLGSAALLLAVGLAAAWVPARRAMLVDPMTTLRRE
jgi:ABC-type antimicrobial peptide transport system permease subunit